MPLDEDLEVNQGYREIPLISGGVATVSAEDYEHLVRFIWYVRVSTGKKYAYRFVFKDGKRTTQSMHREVMGLSNGDPIRVDHINPDETLDNSRLNLRLATSADNSHNTKKHRDNTSGYKGVSWSKAANKWCASICDKGQHTYLGIYDDVEEAAKVYKAAAESRFGEFART